MFIIVGLGNPGAKYVNTRHNIGFMTIDYLAQKYNINVSKIKHKAIIGEGNIKGEKVLLVKPQTFMNLSGESIREIIDFYKSDSNNLVVIYDDMSLEVGRLRIRGKGSDGGHNGIKSIIYQLQTDIFPRIKVGIGVPGHSGYSTVDYVLGKFSKEEQKTIFDSIEKAADASLCIIEKGIDDAMNLYNGKS